MFRGFWRDFVPIRAYRDLEAPYQQLSPGLEEVVKSILGHIVA